MNEEDVIKKIEVILKDKETKELSKGEIWDQVYNELISTDMPFEIYPSLHLRSYGGFSPGDHIHFVLPSYEKEKLEYCISYRTLELRKHRKFECPK